MSTKDARVELLRGTLALLILRTLLPGLAHSRAIAKSIQRSSSDVLQVERLTPKGKKQLTVETSKWDRLAGAIARILHSQTERAE